jgi:hypothetical protein
VAAAFPAHAGLTPLVRVIHCANGGVRQPGGPFSTGDLWSAGPNTLATVEAGAPLRFWDVRESRHVHGSGSGRVTFVLDFDTDRRYDRMCAAYPLGLPAGQGDALFPHLEHRRSCGRPPLADITGIS